VLGKNTHPRCSWPLTALIHNRGVPTLAMGEVDIFAKDLMRLAVGDLFKETSVAVATILAIRSALTDLGVSFPSTS